MSAPARSSSSPTRREGLRADRIWFMEMNTRLQVEHPVTEEITGAGSGRMAAPRGERARRCRRGRTSWRSTAGRWRRGSMPRTRPPDSCPRPGGSSISISAACGEARVDTGVEEGDAVTPFYDPMIAKLIAARPATATRRSTGWSTRSTQSRCWPVKTNAAFLVRAAADADFRAGDVDTGFIPARLDRLVPERRRPTASEPSRARSGPGVRFRRRLRARPVPGALCRVSAPMPTATSVVGSATAARPAPSRSRTARRWKASPPPPAARSGLLRGQAFAFALPGAAGGGAAARRRTGCSCRRCRAASSPSTCARATRCQRPQAGHPGGDEDGA